MSELYSGYCVKCRQKREFEGERKVGPSGRHMAMGRCPTCTTTISRLLPNPKGKAVAEEPVKKK